MIALDTGATPTPTAPAAPEANPLQGADAPPMEPVFCTGGCPSLTECTYSGQACQCPRGPGHCELCPDETFKCVKNL